MNIAMRDKIVVGMKMISEPLTSFSLRHVTREEEIEPKMFSLLSTHTFSVSSICTILSSSIQYKIAPCAIGEQFCTFRLVPSGHLVMRASSSMEKQCSKRQRWEEGEGET